MMSKYFESTNILTDISGGIKISSEKYQKQIDQVLEENLNWLEEATDKAKISIPRSNQFEFLFSSVQNDRPLRPLTNLTTSVSVKDGKSVDDASKAAAMFRLIREAIASGKLAPPARTNPEDVDGMDEEGPCDRVLDFATKKGKENAAADTHLIDERMSTVSAFDSNKHEPSNSRDSLMSISTTISAASTVDSLSAANGGKSKKSKVAASKKAKGAATPLKAVQTTAASTSVAAPKTPLGKTPQKPVRLTRAQAAKLQASGTSVAESISSIASMSAVSALSLANKTAAAVPAAPVASAKKDTTAKKCAKKEEAAPPKAALFSPVPATVEKKTERSAKKNIKEDEGEPVQPTPLKSAKTTEDHGSVHVAVVVSDAESEDDSMEEDNSSNPIGPTNLFSVPPSALVEADRDGDTVFLSSVVPISNGAVAGSLFSSPPPRTPAPAIAAVTFSIPDALMEAVDGVNNHGEATNQNAESSSHAAAVPMVEVEDSGDEDEEEEQEMIAAADQTMNVTMFLPALDTPGKGLLNRSIDSDIEEIPAPVQSVAAPTAPSASASTIPPQPAAPQSSVPMAVSDPPIVLSLSSPTRPQQQNSVQMESQSQQTAAVAPEKKAPAPKLPAAADSVSEDEGEDIFAQSNKKQEPSKVPASTAAPISSSSTAPAVSSAHPKDSIASVQSNSSSTSSNKVASTPAVSSLSSTLKKTTTPAASTAATATTAATGGSNLVSGVKSFLPTAKAPEPALKPKHVQVASLAKAAAAKEAEEKKAEEKAANRAKITQKYLNKAATPNTDAQKKVTAAASSKATNVASSTDAQPKQTTTSTKAPATTTTTSSVADATPTVSVSLQQQPASKPAVPAAAPAPQESQPKAAAPSLNPPSLLSSKVTQPTVVATSTAAPPSAPTFSSAPAPAPTAASSTAKISPPVQPAKLTTESSAAAAAVPVPGSLAKSALASLAEKNKPGFGFMQQPGSTVINTVKSAQQQQQQAAAASGVAPPTKPMFSAAPATTTNISQNPLAPLAAAKQTTAAAFVQPSAAKIPIASSTLQAQPSAAAMTTTTTSAIPVKVGPPQPRPGAPATTTATMPAPLSAAASAPSTHQFVVPAPRPPKKKSDSFTSLDIPETKVDTDDEDEEEDDTPARIPAWAERENLSHALMANDRLNPEDIFVSVRSCNLDEIFAGLQSRRPIRKRTSSAVWEHDRFTPEEEAEYKRQMGFK